MGQGWIDVRSTHQPRNGDNVGAALPRDEARDVLGVAAIAGPDGDVQVLSLRVQRRARQRQPVLPAIQAAHGEWTETMRAQAVAVADGPDEPFLMGRHQFPVHRSDLAVAAYVHHRAVEAVAAAIRGALHDANVDGDIASFSRVANGVEVAVFNADPLAHVVGVQRFLQVGLESRAVSAFDPEGVARDQGLAKHDEITVRRGRLTHPCHDLVDRSGAIQPAGRNLRKSDRDRAFIHGHCRRKK